MADDHPHHLPAVGDGDRVGRSADAARARPLNPPRWRRALWLAAGFAALLTGIVGIVLPLLPTTPFVLLAAFCFGRGSERWEGWLLAHPRFGPLVEGWRTHRAIPRRVKRIAWATMAVGCAVSAWMLPARLAWIPAVCCLGVAWWMKGLPEGPA